MCINMYDSFYQLKEDIKNSTSLKKKNQYWFAEWTVKISSDFSITLFLDKYIFYVRVKNDFFFFSDFSINLDFFLRANIVWIKNSRLAILEKVILIRLCLFCFSPSLPKKPNFWIVYFDKRKKYCPLWNNYNRLKMEIQNYLRISDVLPTKNVISKVWLDFIRYSRNI